MPTYTPVTTDVKADWRNDCAAAKAVEDDPRMINAWTDEHGPFREKAERICAKDCKVAAMCLVDAVFDPQSQGLRGGYFFDEGRVATEENKALAKTWGLRARKRQKTKTTPAIVSEELAPVTDITEFQESELVSA